LQGAHSFGDDGQQPFFWWRGYSLFLIGFMYSLFYQKQLISLIIVWMLCFHPKPLSPFFGIANSIPLLNALFFVFFFFFFLVQVSGTM